MTSKPATVPKSSIIFPSWNIWSGRTRIKGIIYDSFLTLIWRSLGRSLIRLWKEPSEKFSWWRRNKWKKKNRFLGTLVKSVGIQITYRHEQKIWWSARNRKHLEWINAKINLNIQQVSKFDTKIQFPSWKIADAIIDMRLNEQAGRKIGCMKRIQEAK